MREGVRTATLFSMIVIAASALSYRLAAAAGDTALRAAIRLRARPTVILRSFR
jgi:hypothetical protein